MTTSPRSFPRNSHFNLPQRNRDFSGFGTEAELKGTCIVVEFRVRIWKSVDAAAAAYRLLGRRLPVYSTYE
jgi:hypothetical protein